MNCDSSNNLLPIKDTSERYSTLIYSILPIEGITLDNSSWAFTIYKAWQDLQIMSAYHPEVHLISK